MSADSAVDQELARLDGWLAEDFGPNFADFRSLCCEAETGRPLYLSHVKLALECFPNLKLEHSQVDRLSRAYVYLIAVYYLVDAVADGHSCHGSLLESEELLFSIPILQAASLNHLSSVAVEYGFSTHLLHKTLIEYLMQNRQALRLEMQSRLRPFHDWNTEYFHLWARSNCFIFLLDFVANLQGRRLSSKFLEGSHRLLAAIQRGDDCSDWRDDFNRHSYTPFLRLCFSKKEDIGEIDKLEEVVYLCAVMEDELRDLVGEFEQIANYFNSLGEGQPLSRLAALQHSLASSKLEEFHKAWEVVRAEA